MDDGRWTMDDGRWTMDDGRWTMDDGRWTMDDGRWTMDDGRWTMDVGRLTLEDRLWTIIITVKTLKPAHFRSFILFPLIVFRCVLLLIITINIAILE